MGDRRYIISETSAKTGLEAHVLRYWEEELGLKIPRNELGHRYYTEDHIRLFCKIKELKEKGYQLKAIKSELDGKSELKMVLGEPITVDSGESVSEDKTANSMDADNTGSAANAVSTQQAPAVREISSPASSAGGDKLEQFRAIIGGIVTESLRENNVVLQDELASTVSEKVIKEMDYLLRIKEESEDERFKKLDETIRNYQRSSREAAAYSEGRGWRRKRKSKRI